MCGRDPQNYRRLSNVQLRPAEQMGSNGSPWPWIALVIVVLAEFVAIWAAGLRH